jgi:hypothetical protein
MHREGENIQIAECETLEDYWNFEIGKCPQSMLAERLV